MRSSNMSNSINSIIMPRNYNHVIRFLESWFADLEDQAKEFSDAEKYQVIYAIYQCQVKGSLEPLQELPRDIRRGLSLATLGEQILAVLERAESYRKRGRYVREQQQPTDSPAALIKKEQREAEQQQREKKRDDDELALKREMWAWNVKTPLELYHAQLRAAVAGNEEMRKKFPNWPTLAEKLPKV